MASYGSGMLLNTDTSSSKVGESSPDRNILNHSESQLTLFSHSPLRMSFTEHRYLATRGPECNGPRDLLLPREGLCHLLHQQ